MLKGSIVIQGVVWLKNSLDMTSIMDAKVELFIHVTFGVVRGVSGESLFLRVDIVLQGATFYIVFTDADHMHPPYRIDNYSQVIKQNTTQTLG